MTMELNEINRRRRRRSHSSSSSSRIIPSIVDLSSRRGKRQNHHHHSRGRVSSSTTGERVGNNRGGQHEHLPHVPHEGPCPPSHRNQHSHQGINSPNNNANK